MWLAKRIKLQNSASLKACLRCISTAQTNRCMTLKHGKNVWGADNLHVFEMLSQYIDVIHQSPDLGITHYTVTFPNNAVIKCYILNLGNLITATNINKIVTYVTNAVLKKRMRAKMSSKMFVLFIY